MWRCVRLRCPLLQRPDTRICHADKMSSRSVRREIPPHHLSDTWCSFNRYAQTAPNKSSQSGRISSSGPNSPTSLMPSYLQDPFTLSLLPPDPQQYLLSGKCLENSFISFSNGTGSATCPSEGSVSQLFG